MRKTSLSVDWRCASKRIDMNSTYFLVSSEFFIQHLIQGHFHECDEGFHVGLLERYKLWMIIFSP